VKADILLESARTIRQLDVYAKNLS